MNFSLQLNRGATGGSGRAKGGLEAINQWESSAEKQAGPRSNTTVPKLRGSANPSIGRHGSRISTVLPPNFPPPQSWEVAGLSAGTGYSA